MTCQHGQIAVCHNGNLPFANEKRIELEKAGAIFSSTSDTETILHSIARTEAKNPVEAINIVLKDTEGAFSLLFLNARLFDRRARCARISSDGFGEIKKRLVRCVGNLRVRSD